jgi:hypothetical protein
MFQSPYQQAYCDGFASGLQIAAFGLIALILNIL